MTRRAWWLVVLNILLPGSAQVLAGSRGLGRFGLRAFLSFVLLLVLTGALYKVNPELVPDNGVDPTDPDYDYIRGLISAALTPAVE
jgi:hypothetical protein